MKKGGNLFRDYIATQFAYYSIHISPDMRNWTFKCADGGEDDDHVSLLDPTDSFSDPELPPPPPPPSTLDRATADFQAEETVGPNVSEEMALRICHNAKTPLLPEKLKLRMDRELCPSNTPIAAKKVNQSLFNKRGGPSGYC